MKCDIPDWILETYIMEKLISSKVWTLVNKEKQETNYWNRQQ